MLFESPPSFVEHVTNPPSTPPGEILYNQHHSKEPTEKEVTQTLQCPPKASDLRSHVVPALGHWKTLACFLGETAVELPPRHHQVGAANRLGAVEAMHRIACVLRGRPTPQSALSPQCS